MLRSHFRNDPPVVPSGEKHLWRRLVRRLLSLCLSGIILGGAAAGGFSGVSGLLAGGSADGVPQTYLSASAASLDLTNTARTGGMDVSDLAEEALPSVVSITNISVQELRRYYGWFGFNGEWQTIQQETTSCGSGVIVAKSSSALYIVTNYHVIEGAKTLSVGFVDGAAGEASVVGSDEDLDISVIQVALRDLSANTQAAIAVAEFGDSSSLKVGNQVVAIGNALGYGQSVTTGIVSAVDRSVTTGTDSSGTPVTSTYIQTDAAINPGNSGGALLNGKGEVIGMNTVKYSDTSVEGMGYAIPITAVQDRLDDLMNRQTREKVDESEKGYLGISCATVSSDVSEAYGIPEGVLVTDVASKSAAEKAGIKANYVITKIDGQSISSAEELTEKLNYYAVGETVPITYEYLKDDAYVEKTVDVTLMENPNANNK